uniref:Uncharacterized protein n=1 Tax=Vespula pensylvanica TaxID=30213 RepID=A0A834U8C2_VESPE|nr:hypothetical protein H0235_009262 [Vespula pensylvanica]
METQALNVEDLFDALQFASLNSRVRKCVSEEPKKDEKMVGGSIGSGVRHEGDAKREERRFVEKRKRKL